MCKPGRESGGAGRAVDLPPPLPSTHCHTASLPAYPQTLALVLALVASPFSSSPLTVLLPSRSVLSWLIVLLLLRLSYPVPIPYPLLSRPAASSAFLPICPGFSSCIYQPCYCFRLVLSYILHHRFCPVLIIPFLVLSFSFCLHQL